MCGGLSCDWSPQFKLRDIPTNESVTANEITLNYHVDCRGVLQVSLQVCVVSVDAGAFLYANQHDHSCYAPLNTGPIGRGLPLEIISDGR
jgi:hypothetical protein